MAFPALPVQTHLQGVIEEVREDNVIRSVREDSESSCVGEIAFFMGIAQPRTFQVTWPLFYSLKKFYARPPSQPAPD